LQEEFDVKTAKSIPKSDGTAERITKDRRKRINRMKTIIVAVVILLILLPTLCTILLGIQVNRLHKQVEELLILHSKDLSSESLNDHTYAFAAEKKDLEATTSPGNTEGRRIGNTDVHKIGNMEGNSLITKSIMTNSLLTNSKIANSLITNSIITASIRPYLLNITTDGAASATTLLYDLITKSTDNNNSKNTTTEDDIQKDSDEKSTSNTSKNNASSEDEINNTNTGIYSGKKVYLSFDDGPSIYTGEILDILKEYDVKATFFVIGKTDVQSKKIYKRIVDEGHILGMHSYSHVYNYIYNSVEDFDKDFTKLWKLLYDTTGYKPTIFRFPGGSANLVNKNGMTDFVQYLKDKKVVYYDWNVENGDATGVKYTKEQLVNNVLNGIAKKDVSIVLMHDAQSKKSTVDSLPELLDTLTLGGAEILPIDIDVPPIQQIKADKVK
jgi:peptidoglycan-N-acetylglucosamine deacetylase